jgi:hypothetical protein
MNKLLKRLTKIKKLASKIERDLNKNQDMELITYIESIIQLTAYGIRYSTVKVLNAPIETIPPKEVETYKVFVTKNNEEMLLDSYLLSAHSPEIAEDMAASKFYKKYDFSFDDENDKYLFKTMLLEGK